MIDDEGRAAGLRPRWPIGATSPASCGQPYVADLADAAVSRGIEPSLLVFGRGHARQLARRRPADGAVAKGLRERRQGFERFGDAQSFIGPAWFVTEYALDVFGEGAVPQVQVNTGS
jgi:hypothetical protein